MRKNITKTAHRPSSHESREPALNSAKLLSPLPLWHRRPSVLTSCFFLNLADMTSKRDVARNALMEKGNMAENDAYLGKVNIRDDLNVNLSGNSNTQK